MNSSQPARAATSDGASIHGKSQPAGNASELFVLGAESRAGLQAQIEQLRALLQSDVALSLADLSFTMSSAPQREGTLRLALIAANRDDLLKRLDRAYARLADENCHHIQDVTGLYFTDQPLAQRGKIAFLFPGEGAQYLGMLGELAQHFPEVRACFAWCDELVVSNRADATPISQFVEVPTDTPPELRARLDGELRSLDNAMLSVLAADWALHQLLEGLGVEPDVLIGHSAGELAALRAAGVFDDDEERPIAGMQRTLLEQENASEAHAAVLLAAGLAPTAARELLLKLTADGAKDIEQVHVAMENCPHQTVLVGPAEPMAAVEGALQARKTMYERLALARPYHTPLFKPLLGPLAEMFEEVNFRTPRRTVYSATTGQPFPNDPAEIRALALAHWASPVRFIEAIENLYATGVRIFVEVGPRGNLSSFVEDILRGREFLAAPADVQRRGGLTQLHHLIAQLFVHQVPLRLEFLYRHRSVRRIDRLTPQGAVPVMPNRFTLQPTQPNTPAVYAAPRPAAPTTVQQDGRAQVMLRHMALAEQFLADQQLTTERFLARQRGPRGNRFVLHQSAMNSSEQPAATPTPAPTPSNASVAQVGPLIGDVVEHVPGERLIMRRRLDLAEDLYAEDHTVGGREVSKVDANQHGLPVMPMTFTLEMMAEVAALLVPGRVPLSVNDVTLIRWLALDVAVSTVEVKATIESRPDVPAGQTSVRVEVRDLGTDAAEPELANGSAKRGDIAAIGRVLLADHYPTPPDPKPAAFTHARPNTIGLYELYRGLFHGPRFQGVTQLHGFGDEGIEATIQILPRDKLFTSRREPGFLLDPVTVDVAMHPAAGWHLEQPDQAGRVLLPYELGKIEFFAPPPAAGTDLRVRTWIAHASARRFTHDGDVIGPDGRLWCRFTGVKCWRFYLPVDQVNFHGPKDEYFISRDWPLAQPPMAPAASGNAMQSWAVLLEPSADLVQPGMLAAAVRVTLSLAEQAAFRKLTENDDRVAWLFGRVAAKDAARILWRHQCGERLYPADIEVGAASDDRLVATLRNGERPPRFPHIDFACTKGAMVGVATLEGRPGTAIVRLDTGTSPAEADVLASELQILASAFEPREAAARLTVAREALRRALGPRHVADLSQLEPCGFDRATETIEFSLAAPLAAGLSQLARSPLAVRTAREGDLIVAAAYCPEIAT